MGDCTGAGGTWIASNSSCFIFQVATSACGVIRRMPTGLWEAAGPCDTSVVNRRVQPFPTNVADYAPGVPNTTLDMTTLPVTLRSYDDPYLALYRVSEGRVRLDPEGRRRRRPNSGILPCFIIGLILFIIGILLLCCITCDAATHGGRRKR